MQSDISSNHSQSTSYISGDMPYTTITTDNTSGLGYVDQGASWIPDNTYVPFPTPIPQPIPQQQWVLPIQMPQAPRLAENYQIELMRQELEGIRALLAELVALQLEKTMPPAHNPHEEVCGSDHGRSEDHGALEEGSIPDCPDLTTWPPRKK